MTEFRFSDEEYNDVIKETEELKLKKMEEETKKAKKIAEANRMLKTYIVEYKAVSHCLMFLLLPLLLLYMQAKERVRTQIKVRKTKLELQASFKNTPMLQW